MKRSVPFFFADGARRQDVVRVGKCQQELRRHTPTDIIHHSEKQESHKRPICFHLPNLSVCILLNQFYLSNFFLVTIRNFNFSTNCAF